MAAAVCPSWRSAPGPLSADARDAQPLLARADVLTYPVGETARDLKRSRNVLGGCLSLAMPALLTAYLAVMIIRNDAAPDTRSVVEVGLASLPPLRVEVRCPRVLGTHRGRTLVNPLCPTATWAVAGFQYGYLDPSVEPASPSDSTTDESSSHSPAPGVNADVQCTVRARTPRTREWLERGAKPLFAKYEDAYQDDNVLSASETFRTIADVHNARVDDLWALAGRGILSQRVDDRLQPLYHTNATSDSLLSELRASTSDEPSSVDGFYSLAHGVPYFNRPVREEDALAGVPREEGGLANATLSFGELPLCPMPRISTTASLTSSVAASGIGWLGPVQPYSDWRRLQAWHRQRGGDHGAPLLQLHVKASPAHGIAEDVVVEVPTAPLLSIWHTFAYLPSATAEGARRLQFPFLELSLKLQRTDTDSSSVVSGHVVTQGGTLQQRAPRDVYFDIDLWSSLAECGEMFAAKRSTMLDLHALVQSVGANMSFQEFTDFWTRPSVLADFLPSATLAFPGGCQDEAALDSWPVPLCAGVWNFPFVQQHETVNWSLNSTMRAALAALRSRIQNDTAVHLASTLMPIGWDPVTLGTPDRVSGLWLTLAYHARLRNALMQAEHGCGMYCVQSVRGGLGDFTNPVTMHVPRVDANPSTAGVNADPAMLLYVLRRRPAVVCDSTSFSLPWARWDAQELAQGDYGAFYVSPSVDSSLHIHRAAAPVYAALLRTESLQVITVQSTKVSWLVLAGSALGALSALRSALMWLKLSVCRLRKGARSIARHTSASHSKLTAHTDVPTGGALMVVTRRLDRPAAADLTTLFFRVPPPARSVDTTNPLIVAQQAHREDDAKTVSLPLPHRT